MRRSMTILLLVVLAACSSGDSQPEPSAAVSSTTTETFAAGEAPSTSSSSTTATSDVSTATTTTLATTRGVKFVARPDFSNAGDVCAVRPCWQPIFDRVDGKRVTDGWPCEYYDQASYSPEAPYCADKTTSEGDKVQIVCQFQAKDVGGSTWWNRVVIPAERLVEGHGLQPVDGVYYGVAPDRWLGNHGDRGIPCQ